jgi:hypothetical protein
VNREISIIDEERRTWLPLPDILNIVSLMSVVAFCVVVPLACGKYGVWSLRVLAGAATLISFHPLTMAAHYGIPYRKTRPVRLVCTESHTHNDECYDAQYAPVEELITCVVSLILAIVAMSMVKSVSAV